MPNERFELVTPEQLQLIDTPWELCFICQKSGKETLQRPADKKVFL